MPELGSRHFPQQNGVNIKWKKKYIELTHDQNEGGNPLMESYSNHFLREFI